MSFLLETSEPGQDGYFRIGHVALAIPPEQVTTAKNTNFEEFMALRAKFPQIVKTGQSRWDVSVRWRAVLQENSSDPYIQWKAVQQIVAIFRAAPFVEVENSHLRNILSAQDKAFKYKRMAFALKKMKIETDPDIVDALLCTLEMSLFNYLPYTRDMGYEGDKGQTVSAQDSTKFQAYINAWIGENMNSAPTPGGSKRQPDDGPGWGAQTPGVTRFTWREYSSFSGPASSSEDLGQNGWVYDHTVGKDGDVGTTQTFRYLPHEFIVNDDFTADQTGHMFITGMSVTFANNLAQIPLAAYELPTYQHIGPASTKITLEMKSPTPEGEGFSPLTAMLQQLEGQFLKLRAKWRSTASVQRMQAFKVQNQILNLLGIYSLQAKKFSTSTVEEAVIVEATLDCAQYENIYEEIDPFIVKAPPAAYHDTVQGMLKDKSLSNLTPEESNVLKPLLDFQKSYNAQDMSYAFNFLTSNAANYPNVPINIQLTPQQDRAIRQALDVAGPSGNALVLVPNNVVQLPGITAGIKSLRGTYPAVASVIDGHSQVSYADYVVVRQWSQQNGFGLSGDIVSAVDSAISSATKSGSFDPKSDLFDSILQYGLSAPGALQQNFQLLAQSPKFSAAFQEAAGKFMGNDLPTRGYGAYRDLGLKASDLVGTDWNPGTYFIDYSKQIRTDMLQEIQKQSKEVLRGFEQLNQKTPGASVVTEQGISSTNLFSIMQRAAVHEYSMSNAYPTFKLFLIEEDSQGVFYAYDDFYSYSSVSEIEIINYRNKPDACRIILTNLSGILSNKLFDNSTQGKYEFAHENAQQLPLSSDDGTVVANGAGPSKIQASEKYGVNLQDGIHGTQVPLRYFPLQTGTKIQVRMGFSNDPNRLDPVFSGQITQIEDEDGVIELMAQGHMIELVQTPDDDLVADGWNPIGMFTRSVTQAENSAVSFITGHPIDSLRQAWDSLPVHKAAAFGGTILGQAGDAGSVIAGMLKASSAKHFGHWQILQVRDPYIKGFTWKEQLLRSITTPGSNMDALAQTGYDRSADNILVNSIAAAAGTKSESPAFSRPWYFESPNALGWIPGAPSTYSVPKGSHLSPWKIMSDVARRYPNYNLLVKQYGYPVGGDATLVFADPNDWYYSRDPMLGGEEAQRFSDTTDGGFFVEWWNSGSVTGVATATQGTNRQSFISTVDRYFPPQVGEWDFTGDSLAAQIDGTKSIEVFQGILDQLDRIATSRNTNLRGAINNVFKTSKYSVGSPAAAQRAVAALRNSLQTYLKQIKTGSYLQADFSNRTQPVRRFHFVDSDSIIHNGVKINDKISNEVVVGEVRVAANYFIPPQYRRVLDCNENIVNPDYNVMHQPEGVQNAIAQSFLKEEVGKMYQGDLVLRGTPSIQSGDVVMLTDVSTGMVGPLEVDSVIHAYTKDEGFISIVKPRALVLINEVASSGIIAGFILAFTSAKYAWSNGFTELASKHPNLADNAFRLPESTPSDILSLLGLGATMVVGAANLKKMAAILVVPLTRNGRPWIGGLEGYRIGDVGQYLADKIDQFVVNEIAPTIDSYRRLSEFAASSKVPVLPQGSPLPQPVSGTAPKPTGSKSSNVRLPQNIDQLIQQYSSQFGVDPNVARALAYAESGGNPNAKAPTTSASGVFQLTRATARGLNVTDVFDPNQNVRGGIEYLSQMLNRYNGNYSLALQAYHDGPGAVDKGNYTAEGTAEVAKVLRLAGYS